MKKEILLTITTYLALIQIGFCEVPPPIAYYNFENKQSSSLDRTFNGNEATGTGNYTFTNGGAPNGTSPGTAAKLEGGHFRVPNIDINAKIRDANDGSYTMSAWIKPSELNGERYVFGQTSQGIHHGIRNSGFLHSAHWGADWNAQTNLNDYLPQDEDGWIHAAWVYDGENDQALIYLDGDLDGENIQRAQNGGGHLIIGARNNGEGQFIGLIDEVAIWDQVLSADEITQLYQGESPLSSMPDEDEDGLIDAWEQKYTVNLSDLNGKDNESDFDKDQLTDSEEYLIGTNPTESDSDSDGLNDFMEIDNGTNPVNSDTDNDGLLDGDEITAQTDPTNPDSDEDGYFDGAEIKSGSDPQRPN